MDGWMDGFMHIRRIYLAHRCPQTKNAKVFCFTNRDRGLTWTYHDHITFILSYNHQQQHLHPCELASPVSVFAGLHNNCLKVLGLVPFTTHTFLLFVLRQLHHTMNKSVSEVIFCICVCGCCVGKPNHEGF